MDLEMKTTKENGTCSISLNGELNTLTAPEFNDLIEEVLPETEKLVLDFSGCDYVSSAGLRVMFNAFKTLSGRNGSMEFQNIGPNFADTLKATGLNIVFEI